LRVVRASSNDDIERAAELRRQVFLDRRGVLFDDELEALRDRRGDVFLLLEGEGRIVATARVLPFPAALSPLVGLTHGLRTGADSEIGRIAAVRSSNTTSYALNLLVLGSISVMEEGRPWERYVAYCHPRLVELYRLVGARDTGHECAVPGRSDLHRIVTGTYEDAARLGAELLGITHVPRRVHMRRSA
jgi:hypothetical protein